MDLIPLTPYRLTLVLAYCHHYTPNFLPARCLPAAHLRRLALWLGYPASHLRTARDHPALAAHLLVGVSAGLLSTAGGHWHLSPAALPWLDADPLTRIESLRLACADADAWSCAAHALGLRDAFNLAYPTFLAQQLARLAANPPAASGPAVWQPATDAWQLRLPPNFPPALLFHLLQIGRWTQPETPGDCWTADGYTIARAAQRGYSLTFIEAILSRATDLPFTLAQRQQLLAWYRRHDAVQVQPVYLLQTSQPAELAAILTRRRLRQHVTRQLSPRHAVVAPAIIPALRRHLEPHTPLLAPDPEPPAPADLDPLIVWLGLRVLAEIGRLIPLAIPRDEATMEQVAVQLSPAQQAAAEHHAVHIAAALREALHGRDAFFPREKTEADGLLTAVQAALSTGEALTLHYQGLGDDSPRCRTVSPLRLEQRGALTYLHAYCHLAEAERVFRLDRVTDWSAAGAPTTGAFVPPEWPDL